MAYKKNDAKNVTSAKPKVGGAVFVAPLETPVPKDAKAELNEAFKNLGFVSTEGLKNNNTASTKDTKAWGGATVNTTQTEKTDKFQLELIESLNVDTLKFVYGEDNVTGTLETGIAIKAGAEEAATQILVVDMILKDGILKRIVVPLAKLTEMGEIVYNDEDSLGYDVTITAFLDGDGGSHYEYIAKKG